MLQEIDIVLDVEEEEPIDMEVSDSGGGGFTTDYLDLLNKPRLNDKTIQGDMYEEDPTVPDWAKQENKPSYEASEVNAVNRDDSISYAELDELFKQVFGG